ncbi:MAG: hypothetical protein JRD47_10270 [Deltaproteobacteria bacterium]|nr:hypothetical protein [Deltaproteobacteria bacterium]MBW2265764.1 hypothetical protein [Deltaproteobacteria bacterium]MBW2602282.1 hypothetical protein [Deltaproteobacteria bacterium]
MNGFVRSRKDVYAATLLGSLHHWLEDNPDVTALVEKVRELPEPEQRNIE